MNESNTSKIKIYTQYKYITQTRRSVHEKNNLKRHEERREYDTCVCRAVLSGRRDDDAVDGQSRRDMEKA